MKSQSAATTQEVMFVWRLEKRRRLRGSCCCPCWRPTGEGRPCTSPIAAADWTGVDRIRPWGTRASASQHTLGESPAKPELRLQCV
ncbi:hypothetical protein E2C01_055321 [Portunus trituberculatus]|uniref:Uncharacterized protein n=1 Tax=Portunus trituberculatus TaxID=210409 RepID=A0A5B7GXD0_PORTR|nr:hypothetical protein [Portunus trituberculatus]